MSARALDSSAGVWADIGSLGEVTERDNSQTQGIFPRPVYVRAILVLHGQNDMLLHTLFDSPPRVCVSQATPPSSHFHNGTIWQFIR